MSLALLEVETTAPLTRLQDLEFGIFGALHQGARASWGAACMGGNGQMTRLTALDSVAGPEGPWRPMLTEDQDLGLRLLACGWRSAHEPRVAVRQQGLRSPRRLLRQRVRWCQGNLECLTLAGVILRSPLPRLARFELLAFMVAPFMEAMVAVATLAAIAFVVTGAVDPIPSGGPVESGLLVLALYLLGAGGVLMGFLSRATGLGPAAHLKGLVVANLYFPYTWMVWAVLAGAVWRHALGRNSWAKTERDGIATGSPDPS